MDPIFTLYKLNDTTTALDGQLITISCQLSAHTHSTYRFDLDVEQAKTLKTTITTMTIN